MSATHTAPRNDAAAISCPRGFVAGGTTCGIKESGKPDLAVIACPGGAAAAAMFTRNLVKAAPLLISESNLDQAGGRCHGVVVSSGCANAATGEEGRRRASRVVEALAKRLQCKAEQILINSTGVIGVQLPDEKILAGLAELTPRLSAGGFDAAAEAIITTDTHSKMAVEVVESGGRSFTVAGFAKGSGMIHPNMATMIGVIMTDAAVEPPSLDRVLRGAVEKSFHRISVDGDTSTNDSVFLLASGAAGRFDESIVAAAVEKVARNLALQVVRDGEGARRLINVRVHEARTSREALQIAQTVAGSLLVRTAVAGGDPNWGRIVAAIGRSGVELDVDRIRIAAGPPGDEIELFSSGAPSRPSKDQLAGIFAGDEVVIDVRLGQGQAFDEFFTCDLTEGYIRINADYTT